MTLALEVAALEVETELVARLTASGYAVPGKRAPFPHEVAARVKFGAIDDITARAVADIAPILEQVRSAAVDELANAVTGALDASPWEALDQLGRLADPTSPDAMPATRQSVEEARTAIAARLVEAAEEGAREAAREATRQGVPDHLVPRVTPARLDEVRAAANAHATRVAAAPARKALDAATEAAAVAASGDPDVTGADILLEALDAAESASTAGADDLARQAVNVSHGLGRTAQLTEFPEPSSVYASELLDGNTCGPCTPLDGRTYDSMQSALEDYPGAGGYVGCDGGARCRGTLVIVHNTEAAPTLDGGADTTRRGATGAARPSHIDDEGRIIPVDPLRDLPWSDRVPDDVAEQIAWELTTQAPTPAPSHPLEHANEDGLDGDGLDPAWSGSSDDDLREALQSAQDDGSDDALEYAAQVQRELDARAASGRRVTAPAEPAVTWEQSTYVKVTRDRAGTGRPAGKSARAERDAAWALEVERVNLALEEATRGHVIRPDRAAEFEAKHVAKGRGIREVIVEGRADTAYRYMSAEAREFFDTVGGRITRAEFEVLNGARDAQTLARAKAAALARQQAVSASEVSDDVRAEAKRARQRETRRRDTGSAGARFERERRRVQRARRLEDGGA